MDNITEMIERAKEIIELSKENKKSTAIISHQWILQTPMAYKTVGSKWNAELGKEEAIVENTITPAQFTKEEAKRLQKICVVRDGDGNRIELEMIHYTKFYENQQAGKRDLLKCWKVLNNNNNFSKHHFTKCGVVLLQNC